MNRVLARAMGWAMRDHPIAGNRSALPSRSCARPVCGQGRSSAAEDRQHLLRPWMWRQAYALARLHNAYPYAEADLSACRRSYYPAGLRIWAWPRAGHSGRCRGSTEVNAMGEGFDISILDAIRPDETVETTLRELKGRIYHLESDPRKLSSFEMRSPWAMP